MNSYPLGRVENSAERLVYWYFATPLLKWQIPEADAEFNARLLGAILARRAAEPKSNEHSNRRGWQSARDLFAWPEPECTLVRDWALKAAHRMDSHLLDAEALVKAHDVATESWANVSPSGAFHLAHAHMGYAWSGVYYVDAPSNVEEDTGRIEFIDPRTNVSLPGYPKPLDTSLSIQPRAGLMVMFPSWLQHYVTPHFDDALRVSIAFNLRRVQPES